MFADVEEILSLRSQMKIRRFPVPVTTEDYVGTKTSKISQACKPCPSCTKTQP